ncbi:DUF2304 domain-containing protein [candidate division KSB1 bacterium]|nr:DUF2304 domain-containing protein [candidate division KSB1 bacterium]
MDIKARIFICLVSMAILVFVINFIRRKNLKEEYALFWVITGFLLLLAPIFSDAIEGLAHFVGIYYEPALVFVIAILGLLLIMFHYSVVISKLAEQNKSLTQNLALLEKKVNDIEKNYISHDEKSANAVI